MMTVCSPSSLFRSILATFTLKRDVRFFLALSDITTSTLHTVEKTTAVNSAQEACCSSQEGALWIKV